MLFLLLTALPAWGEEILPGRQQALRDLLKQDCGACHGLTLKGGMGPALLPETLAGKSDDFLADTILNGRPGTAMPPWQPFMNHEEALWLVKLMRETLWTGQYAPSGIREQLPTIRGKGRRLN